MEIFIKVFHILVSVILIFVVLLQSGKGASMGAAFGGSRSNALFGATGTNNFMAKLTTFIAIIFIITCLTLAYMSSHMATSTLMSDVQSEAPMPAQTAPGAPPVGMPTGAEAPPVGMPAGTEAPPIEAGTEAPPDHPPIGAGTEAPPIEAPAEAPVNQ